MKPIRLDEIALTDEQRVWLEGNFIDWYAKRAEEQGEDPEEAARKATIYLLERGYQPSRGLLMLLTYELTLLWWPNRQEKNRYRTLCEAEAKGEELAAAIARKRSEGLREKDAVAEAREEVRRRWRHNSVSALLQSLKPSRVRRRKVGPKQRK